MNSIPQSSSSSSLRLRLSRLTRDYLDSVREDIDLDFRGGKALPRIATSVLFRGIEFWVS